MCMMDYAIHQESGELVFLHKLVEGICESSFGIKVARMAGLSEGIC